MNDKIYKKIKINKLFKINITFKSNFREHNWFNLKDGVDFLIWNWFRGLYLEITQECNF